MRFHVRTYGCQMNDRDSEAIRNLLADAGHHDVVAEEDADVLIFNTCSVRESAERKAFGKIGILKRLKRVKPDIVIGVVGCAAQRLGEAIFERLPHVDFVLGTDQEGRIVEVVEDEVRRRGRRIHTERAAAGDPRTLDGDSRRGDSPTAFISVMRGCGRFCSYCIVPYVRGPERSRPHEDVVAEARRLVDDGAREITLLGQNVAAYGLDGAPSAPSDDHSPFAELLSALSGIEGLARLRFTSPHPAYFNKRLIDTVIDDPKVCDHVHLPLQSGSNVILKAMNRPYTAERYLEIVERLRSGKPGMAFSTDVIVGFPGETSEDFKQTRSVMEKVGFDNAYIFKYSPREGTAAAKLPDSVATKAKEERNQILLADLARRTERHNRELVGSEFEVLVEGPSKRNPNRWHGRTSSNKVVVFPADAGAEIGDLITVRIQRATAMTLFAIG